MLSSDHNTPLEASQLLFTQQEELGKPVKVRTTITHIACNTFKKIVRANARLTS